MVQRKQVSQLIGMRFGRLTVVEYDGVGKCGKHYWECLCDCGEYTTLATYRLTGASPTLSCGCLRKEKMKENRADPTKHGLSKHPLYGIYYSMLQRCNNPKSQRYKYYGGKGVVVSDDFATFDKFYDWAISNGWSEGMSIDRIDSCGDYCRDSCEWVTVSENSRRMNEHRRDEASAKG